MALAITLQLLDVSKGLFYEWHMLKGLIIFLLLGLVIIKGLQRRADPFK